MSKSLKLSLLAGLALSMVTSGALGQGSESPKKTEEPVLKGPTVKEGVPGEQRQFSPGRMKGKDMMGGEIPHRAFMRALEPLRAEDAEAGVRLTGDQNSQIRKINDDFTSTVSKYREEHLSEVRELLTKLTPEDRRRAQEFLGRMGENRRPELDRKKNAPKKDAEPRDGEGMKQVDPKQAEVARERLRELLAGAPNPADTHARIFGVLNDTQKKAFKEELEKVQTEMKNRRGDMDKRPEGRPGDPMGMDDLPPNARERLKNMTPQQREEALKRLKERRDKRGNDGKGGEGKPTPSTKDDVKVPDPD